jgi:hypothetical protein
MPTPTTSTLERAFELARSGRCRTAEEIFRALRDEGHDRRLVVGPYLMKQLKVLMNEAARLRRSS